MFGGWGGAIASAVSGIFGGAVSAATDALDQSLRCQLFSTGMVGVQLSIFNRWSK